MSKSPKLSHRSKRSADPFFSRSLYEPSCLRRYLSRLFQWSLLPATIALKRDFSNSSPPTSATRTRAAAYAQATREFLAWCERARVASIPDVQPLHVAVYIERLRRERSAPTVKRPPGAASRGSAGPQSAFHADVVDLMSLRPQLGRNALSDLP
jgi:hypothetical protein